MVEFAHLHVDFHIPEVASILEMEGLMNRCSVYPLPNQCFEPCTLKEFITLTSCMGTLGNVVIMPPRSFLILSFSSCGASYKNEEEEERLILDALSQCVLARGVIELWAADKDVHECAAQVKSLSSQVGTATNKLVKKHCIDQEKSWKFTIATIGTKYSREEQNQIRSKFAFLPFAGPVVMDGPEEEYVLIKEVELDGCGSPLYPRFGHSGNLIPENDARPPLAVYFGRVLGGGRNFRDRLLKYDLKARSYLGPTSLDNELSMIMTNLAQVKKGSTCFDPFVGTGSILLTCALKGAYCFGTDIDIRVLKGKGDNQNIMSNFKQFNLPRPELVRSDNSIYHRHYRSHTSLYDAIVCDPPYGIRAGARRSGSKLDKIRPILDNHRHDHIAQTRPYAISDVMADLLDVAARSLVMDGNLVYIIPSMADFNPETDLPIHPCLEQTYCCYQPLHVQYGRRVVVMKKKGEYLECQQERYKASAWINGAESAEKVANVRERLLEEAKRKP